MRPLDLSASAFTYDDDAPEGFRAGRRRLGREVGAHDSGATLHELPPGQAICPYHYEHGEEEWVLGVEGVATVRTPGGTTELRPNELLFFAVGPEGAHQVRNDSAERAVVLMFSTVVFPTSTTYPDSGKVGVYTRDGTDDLIVQRSSAVDYYEGESNP